MAVPCAAAGLAAVNVARRAIGNVSGSPESLR